MEILQLLVDSAAVLSRTALTAVLSYLALVGLLRITGKRTVSKWNAFDLIITVVIGSMLATTILARDVSIPQGLVGLSVLILLQLGVTWASVRFDWIESLIKARPTLLVCDGLLIDDAMRSQRVPLEEIKAAVRRAGRAGIENVSAAVLETDGSISIIGDVESGRDWALRGIEGWKVR